MGKKNKKCCKEDSPLLPLYVIGENVLGIIGCKTEAEAIKEGIFSADNEGSVIGVYKLIKMIRPAEPTVEDVK